MELLQIKNLSFTYPNSRIKALNNVNLSVERGSFILICGESGCGKTTLLRLLKNEIAPFGKQEGEIIYNKTDIKTLTQHVSCSDIGFVGQNPDQQIVTDKVWHELAFGLENLGYKSNDIRKRVCEMASYFGIENWYHKSTNELSGGQKQILNLASVMVMQPKLLLLDEPTSQLDPIASTEFITTLQRLNSELDLTIILVEHRMEELFPLIDNVMALENGSVIFNGASKKACVSLKNHKLISGFPSSARIWSKLNIDCECPVTVKEGREFLNNNFADKKGKEIEIKAYPKSEPVLQADSVYFRYDKKSSDILSDFKITVNKSEIYSILGGNGTGKTTALNILSGLDKPYKGRIKVLGKRISEYKGNSLYRNTLALLPQNPQTMFIKDNVYQDFQEILSSTEYSEKGKEDLIKTVSEELSITRLLDKHPYDLSGGEQQKCALAKILLTEPRVLLLDEPTKGMDAFYKNNLTDIMKRLKFKGMTIIMVSHDIEFSATVSDRCALLFDGEIISEDIPNKFFSDNSFYTTSASRISRDLFRNSILCDEVVALCK